MTAPLRLRIGQGTRTAPATLAVTPAGRLLHDDAMALVPAVPQGARVAVSLDDPLALLRVLVALDGHVGALLLVSAAAAPDVVGELARQAECDITVSDRADLRGLPGALAPRDACRSDPGGAAAQAGAAGPTEWLMTTSGTTGIPKIVPHTLDSLARTVRRDPLGRSPVWGLVLDPTRFAGLQVTLQAVLGGGTLAIADTHAPMADQIAWLAGQGVTHMSATPTLWRRLLMAPGLDRLALRQVTLGGEIADQGVLDALRARFPDARITHIYASTEAGVGFAVNDRRAGFPLDFLDHPPGGVGVAVRDGLLWLRPPGRRQVRYLGGQPVTVDADGFVLTGDRIEIADDRALFLGRDSGVVNVGGVKVWPERVERIIAAVPGVGMAAVNAKSSPITGALLIATVVPADPACDRETLKTAIMARCRASLEREAVPARLRFADSLATNAAGKITRA
jgi:acyl-CoA synthetase (AMP-forming)/AMP-acid ligase II